MYRNSESPKWGSRKPWARIREERPGWGARLWFRKVVSFKSLRSKVQVRWLLRTLLQKQWEKRRGSLWGKPSQQQTEGRWWRLGRSEPQKELAEISTRCVLALITLGGREETESRVGSKFTSEQGPYSLGKRGQRLQWRVGWLFLC